MIISQRFLGLYLYHRLTAVLCYYKTLKPFFSCDMIVLYILMFYHDEL